MSGRELGFVVNVIIFPFLAAIMGKVIFDTLTPMMNAYPRMPMDAINTFTFLELIFVAGPFLFVFALGYNHMVQSNNEADQVT